MTISLRHIVGLRHEFRVNLIPVVFHGIAAHLKPRGGLRPPLCQPACKDKPSVLQNLAAPAIHTGMRSLCRFVLISS